MFGLCQAGSREEAVWAQWTALGISELLPGIRFGCDHLFPGTCERTREELCPVLGLIREVSAQPLLSSFCRQLPVLPQVSGVPWAAHRRAGGLVSLAELWEQERNLLSLPLYHICPTAGVGIKDKKKKLFLYLRLY